MQSSDTLHHTLIRLREEASLSQAELAKRLQCAASRVSRIESGETSTTIKDAIEIAKAIDSPNSKSFRAYLEQDWRIIPKPGFSHPDLVTLRTAEAALQRLDELLADPDLRNAFVRQIESCQTSLRKAAEYLASIEHPVVFFGGIGVGKTSAICVIGDLRIQSSGTLNQQMALQAGSGRTTVCEVHVLTGGGYGISVEPCSDGEIRQYINDFSEFLLDRSPSFRNRDQQQGSGISTEIERAMRSMTKLITKKEPLGDGRFSLIDPGTQLVENLSESGDKGVDIKEKLRIEIFSRLNLAARTKVSEAWPRSSSEPGLSWLSKVFRSINMGLHPGFSIPKRIDVSVPNPLLGSEAYDLRLVDTRGIDEPSAPRQDLQRYLDNERAVLVFCSSFSDAPSAAIQAVIERAIEGGLKSTLEHQGLVLVLPKGDEESGVVDDQTGETVSNSEEGRYVREYQSRSTTLSDLGIRDLPMLFLNIRNSRDTDGAKKRILNVVENIRGEMRKRVETLAATAENLIENRENAEVQAVFQEVIRHLKVWLKESQKLPGEGPRPAEALLENMDGLRYVSTLRASVNRFGDYYNFPFWHGIGFGLRCMIESRAAPLMAALNAVLKNLSDDAALESAHGFLHHFMDLLASAYREFLLRVEDLGTAAFNDEVRGDGEYWKKSMERWGQGKGYKGDIRQWTEDAFDKEDIRVRERYVEAEVQRFWTELLLEMARHLELGAEVKS